MNRRIGICLALTPLIVTACGSVPPDPNMTRADRDLKAFEFTACVPKTEQFPKLVNGRAPVYPVSLLLLEKDGHAIIEFDITSDGRAKNLVEVESSNTKFYNHTHIAVQDWTFEPAMQGGVAVTVRCRFRQGFVVPYKMRR